MTTQAATHSFKQAIPKVLPPSSPFSELLRQSKFASFDPCIRQAYSAPPSYTHKGNFGLKRPISNRKSNAYIVLKNFDEHAHYIDWDNAKAQVKWLKKVEEVYVAPQLRANSFWAAGLGPSAASRESGLDSEFCPGETAEVVRDVDEEGITGQAEDSAPELSSNPPPPVAEIPISAETILPPRGKGSYGANADENDIGKMFLQPNVSAMSTAEFRRYMEKLRELRPEFIAYVREQLKEEASRNKNDKFISVNLDDKEFIADLASLILDYKFHLRFMGLKTEAEYDTEPAAEDVFDEDHARLERMALLAANAPQPIRPQPHKYAGLMYSHPTLLETRFINKPQPGIYLEQTTSQMSMKTDHIASFAGTAAQFRHLGVGAKPVFKPGSGPDLDDLAQGTRLMSPTILALANVPTVVGRTATSKPMLYVQVKMSVSDHAGVDRNRQDNPHTPGTFEYNSIKSLDSRTRPSATTIPDRAHARSRHLWGNNQISGRVLYSAFDPKSSNSPFRKLPNAEVREEATAAREVIGSMIKQAFEKADTGEGEPT